MNPNAIPYHGRAYFLQKARKLVAELTPRPASLTGGQVEELDLQHRVNTTLDRGEKLRPCGIGNTSCYGYSASFWS